jgi:hypothetical protein
MLKRLTYALTNGYHVRDSKARTIEPKGCYPHHKAVLESVQLFIYLKMSQNVYWCLGVRYVSENQVFGRAEHIYYNTKFLSIV